MNAVLRLAMIMVDPPDNSATGINDDAKNEADAKLKIDNIYQQLQGKADFATVARAKSEDINSLAQWRRCRFCHRRGSEEQQLSRRI